MRTLSSQCFNLLLFLASFKTIPSPCKQLLTTNIEAVKSRVQISTKQNVTTLTLKTKNRNHNPIDADFVKSLELALDLIEQNKSLKGLIIKSGEENFSLGVPLEKLLILDTQENALIASRRYNNLLMRIEHLDVPTVTIIDGKCLGGGFELALATDYRIAIDTRFTKLWLPEKRLNIIPGAGGILRLMKIAGPEAAFTMIFKQKLITPQDAYSHNIIDTIESSPEKGIDKALNFIESKPSPSRYQPTADFVFAENFTPSTPWEVTVFQLIQRHLSDRPFNEALIDEQTIFSQLIASPEAKQAIDALVN